MDCLLPPITSIPTGTWECPLWTLRHTLPQASTRQLHHPSPILDFDSNWKKDRTHYHEIASLENPLPFINPLSCLFPPPSTLSPSPPHRRMSIVKYVRVHLTNIKCSSVTYNEVLALKVLHVINCVEWKRRAKLPASAWAHCAVAAAPSFQACLCVCICTFGMCVCIIAKIHCNSYVAQDSLQLRARP